MSCCLTSDTATSLPLTRVQLPKSNPDVSEASVLISSRPSGTGTVAHQLLISSKFQKECLLAPAAAHFPAAAGASQSSSAQTPGALGQSKACGGKAEKQAPGVVAVFCHQGALWSLIQNFPIGSSSASSRSISASSRQLIEHHSPL